MQFYEDHNPMSFYGGQPSRMLPPIIGLGNGLEGPVAVSSALPAFQAAAISAYGSTIPSTLSSLVLGITAGSNGLAANALTQLYQQQQVDNCKDPT
jgi:hypothetical protein